MSAKDARRAKADKNALRVVLAWYSGRGATRASMRKRPQYRGFQYRAGQPANPKWNGSLLSVTAAYATVVHRIDENVRLFTP